MSAAKARSEKIGRGHDLRLGTRVLLGHSSIISLAIRSSWHPIQRESFLFCLTYTCSKSKYHERYKTTKHETILHKLWRESGGKLQMKGVKGG